MTSTVRRTARLPPVPTLVAGAVLAGCGPEDPEDILEDELEDLEAPRIGAPVLAGDPFEVAEDTGHGLVSVVYVPAPGFAYQEEGRLTGVTVEILRDFAAWVEREHGIDLELEWVEEPEWSIFYETVRDAEGGVLGIGNVTITEERREELSFSPPYMTNVAVLITHEDVPELQSMREIPEAFQGMSAVPFEGTLHEERVRELQEQRWPDLSVEPVSSNEAIVERVASGEGYFGWIDIYNYWRERGEEPIRRHPVADDAAEAFGIIMPRETDWAPVVDDFFREGEGYVESERYREILETHLGEELADELERARAGALGQPGG